MDKSAGIPSKGGDTMTTTTEYKTRTDGKKEYQVKITRQKGLQTVMIDSAPRSWKT